MDSKALQEIIQAVIQASKEPVSLKALCQVFADSGVDSIQIQAALDALLKKKDPVQELKFVAGGYRFQIKAQFVPWIKKLKGCDQEEEKFSAVFTETLAIIAYKQPVSRGEIEYIRGKSMSQTVLEALLERRWIKVVGYGGEHERAMLYGTTDHFLAYFGLPSIHDLPPLPEALLAKDSA